MPILVFELINSRTGCDGPNATSDWKYMVKGSDDDTAIKLAVRAVAPSGFTAASTPTPQTFALDNVSLDEQHTDGLWSCTAHYMLTDQKPPDTGEMVFSFDTTSGTAHITQSIQTMNSYPKGGALTGSSGAPDLGGTIGASGDSIDGVDITVPTYAFSETHYLPDSAVTDSYKGLLFRLTGTCNTKPFKGGQAGEILFLGATGSKRGKGDWEITFKFAGSPNATGLTVGSINDITKGGWEYLWVRYTKKVLGSGDDAVLTMTPKHVYVEKVYRDGDHTLLGIGT